MGGYAFGGATSRSDATRRAKGPSLPLITVLPRMATQPIDQGAGALPTTECGPAGLPAQAHPGPPSGLASNRGQPDDFFLARGRGATPMEGWHSPPPPSHAPAYPLDPAQRSAWQELRDAYLKTGAIRPARSRRHVSPAFLRPKPNGKWRLIVDLRRINAHCVPQSVSYETLNTLRESLQKGDWMVTFDIKDAYHHIPIHPEDRQYFTFQIDGELWECLTLPFGWQGAPMVFTKVMRTVIAFLRSPQQVTPRLPQSWANSAIARYWEQNWGPLLLPYLDDILGAAKDTAVLRTWTTSTRKILTELGITVNEEKSSWSPTQTKVHLGLIIDTSRGLFVVPDEKAARLRRQAHNLMMTARSSKGRVPARKIASFCGLAQSVGLAVRPARFFLQALYMCLRTKCTWSSWVRVDTQAMEDLRWWSLLCDRWNGRAIWRPPAAIQLATDSSDFGWGAELRCEASPAISSTPQLLLARGFWPAEYRNSISISRNSWRCIERSNPSSTRSVDNTSVYSWTRP